MKSFKFPCCMNSYAHSLLDKDTFFAVLPLYTTAVNYYSNNKHVIEVQTWILGLVLSTVTVKAAVSGWDLVTDLTISEYPISLLWETLGLLFFSPHPFAVWSVLQHMDECWVLFNLATLFFSIPSGLHLAVNPLHLNSSRRHLIVDGDNSTPTSPQVLLTRLDVVKLFFLNHGSNSLIIIYSNNIKMSIIR